MATTPLSSAAAVASDYVAFISYRHTDNAEEDRQWATWLHHQLEVYDIPTELIGTRNRRGETIPERLYPVFRDETALPADADLGAAITDALDRSQFLVVLCSPRAVLSPYVNHEITHFKASGKSDQVIAASLLGSPNASLGNDQDPEDVRTLECFPESLRFEVTEDGNVQRDRPAAPLAADFRLADGHKGFTNPNVYKQQLLERGVPKVHAESLATAYEEKLATAKLKIIASILGVELERLTVRDKVHQLKKAKAAARKARQIGAVMGVLLVMAVGGALTAWQQVAEAAGNTAIAERDRVETLLGYIRTGINFMNFDLETVLEAYVPTAPRERVMKQVQGMGVVLEKERGDTVEDIRHIAVAQAQRADLILQSSNQDPATALPLLEAALAGFQRLVALDPDNTEFQRDVSISYNRLGDIQLRLGHTDDALALYQNALDVRLKLVALAPDNTQFQRDVSVSYNKLGNIQLRLGNTDDALALYQNALDVALKLVALDPDNTQFQRDASVSYEKLGDIQLRLGNTDDALALYRNAFDVALKLVALDPDNTEFQRDVSVSYEKLGDIQLRLGNTDDALALYQNALDVRLKLVALDPDNTQFQRDVSVSYNKLGDIQLRLGNTDDALALYQNALDVALKLVALDPDNTQFQRDVSVSYSNLGDIQLRLGNTDDALIHYQNDLDVALKLVALDPDNAQFQRDVSVSYGKLGDIQLRLGHTDGAIALYQNALDVRLKLVDLDPGNASSHRDLMVSHAKLGHFYDSLSQPEKARTHYVAARDKLLWMQSHGILASDDVAYIQQFNELIDP